MKLRMYQIDAFTDQVFGGNPAAVVPLSSWLPDDLMQRIAAENNLSETAFFVPKGDAFEIRWFTPASEVSFCGHATLASAFVIFDLEPRTQEIRFETRKVGHLGVKRGERLEMDFPAIPLEVVPVPSELLEGLRVTPECVLKSYEYYFVVLENEAAVRAVRPNFAVLERFLPVGVVVVTAPGETSDCVSRCFAPGNGIPEDPVTGSAHASLVPYWAERLGKSSIHALQASKRGGHLYCEARGERVVISGYAVKYLEGVIHV